MKPSLSCNSLNPFLEALNRSVPRSMPVNFETVLLLGLLPERPGDKPGVEYKVFNDRFRLYIFLYIPL